MRDSAAGDSRAADLIGRRARCRPLSYETFDGDRADVTTLETMMRMVERKMQQDSLHPDVALYVVRPIWTIKPLSHLADDAKIIFRYRPTFSSSPTLWRHRNYDRLDTHFSGITDFLVAMSVVIARPA